MAQHNQHLIAPLNWLTVIGMLAIFLQPLFTYCMVSVNSDPTQCPGGFGYVQPSCGYTTEYAWMSLCLMCLGHACMYYWMYYRRYITSLVCNIISLFIIMSSQISYFLSNGKRQLFCEYASVTGCDYSCVMPLAGVTYFCFFAIDVFIILIIFKNAFHVIDKYRKTEVLSANDEVEMIQSSAV